MATTYALIESYTVGSGGAASVTLGSGGTIPQTYTDLYLSASLRNTNKNYGGFQFRLNNSSSSYSYRSFGGNAGSIASSTTSEVYWVQSDMTGNTFSCLSIYIPNYTGSNYKIISIDNVTEQNASSAWTQLKQQLWSNTSPITSISMGTFDNVDSFAQYSTFYLYGIKNS